MNTPDWNAIYTAEAPKLIAIARRYVQETATAEDLVQESFIKAMAKFGSFKGEGKLGAWLRRIVINEALMHLRKSNSDTIEISTQLPEMEDDDEVLQLHWSIDELLEAIDSLPAHHRAVFNLYALDDYKHREIAQMLDISENTSKSHLMRARIQLQSKLEAMAKEKKKERKLAGAFFFGSAAPIDAIFKKGLTNHQIKPSAAFRGNINSEASTSKGLSLTNKVWIGGGSLAVAAMAVALYFTVQSDEDLVRSAECEVRSQQLNISTPQQINISTPQQINSSTNKPAKTATISKNRIMESENNNSETILKDNNMNFKQTLGMAFIATHLFAADAFAQAGTGYNRSSFKETKARSTVQKKEEPKKEERTSKVEPAKHHNAAQVSFMYPVGSAGMLSPETECGISFNVLSGITHSVNGFELAGLSNMNRGHMDGCQISGILNQTMGHTSGLQLSGVYNYTGEYFNGLQLSGIFNYADWEMKGMQLSGIMNYAGEEMNGMQLSLVNYAKTVKGFQLGLINIADSIDSKSAGLALLSIYRNGGYREIELFSSDYMLAGANFKIGSRRLYTIFSLGYQNTDRSLWAFGAGLGTILELSPRFWVQPEAYTLAYNSNPFQYNDNLIQSHRLKLGFRYNINKHLALSLAPSVACNIHDADKGKISHIDPFRTWNNDRTVDLIYGGSFGISWWW